MRGSTLTVNLTVKYPFMTTSLSSNPDKIISPFFHWPFSSLTINEIKKSSGPDYIDDFYYIEWTDIRGNSDHIRRPSEYFFDAGKFFNYEEVSNVAKSHVQFDSRTLTSHRCSKNVSKYPKVTANAYPFQMCIIFYRLIFPSFGFLMSYYE